MYLLGSPNRSLTVKFIIDYSPVYLKLMNLLAETGYAFEYSKYSNEDFEQLIPELLRSYFSLDGVEATEVLYATFASCIDSPDQYEQAYADRALGIVDEIDYITKLHFPRNSRFGESPFIEESIISLIPIGKYRVMIEMSKQNAIAFKDNISLLEKTDAGDTTDTEAKLP